MDSQMPDSLMVQEASALERDHFLEVEDAELKLLECGFL